MVRHFLYNQLYFNSEILSDLLKTTAYPAFNGNVYIFYSAVATFCAPSDDSHGINGMSHKYIWAMPSWRGGVAQYDCAFINLNPEIDDMCGLEVVCVLTFFSFSYNAQEYQCALIHWFSCIGTGPEFDKDKDHHIAVVHVNSIYRAMHLVPVYQTGQYISQTLTMHDTLDTFSHFYINKYVDYHAFEIAF